MLSKVACHGWGKELNTVISSGVRIVGDGGLESIYTSLHLALQPIVHPTLYPSIHPASFPPPPTHSHLPASHHQCSQGDERHGEEGPQGINFSHGLESSSQKTWQPQTAWLKKKRREEERKGKGEGKGGGEEGEFFTWWPWERDFGYWVSFFSSSKAPMSWLRMSKLFLLFFHHSLCCPA